MQLIGCSVRPAGTPPNGGECGETTYLIDGSYTLEKGWYMGPADAIGIAPFYVCPNHVWWYQLRELPAAVISPPPCQPRDTEVTDVKPASAPGYAADVADDPGPAGDSAAGESGSEEG